MIRFSLPAHSAIDLASELGHINADVNIVGPGSDQLDVHRAGGGNYRVFTIDAGTVSISGLTISNGASTGHAGGIQNGGASTLKLVRVDVTHNTVNTPGSGISNGGGVSNYGTLTVDRSAVTDNAVNASTNMFGAVSNGGGIYNAGGTLTVDRTTVSGNSVNATQGNPTSVAAGGGIYNNGSATTTIRRSTVSANTANASGASASNNNQASGGGIDGGGSFQLDRVTVSGNSATAPPGGLTQGGGVDSSSLGSMTVRSSTLTANAAALGANFLDENSNGSFARTIVSNPKDGGGNCSIVSSTSNGYNLEDDPGPTPSCGFTEATDQSGVNPELGPLKNNGGPTKTHALLSGSPAIDRVPATGFACAASDQRGYRRPDNGEARCDIGAYEFQDPPDTKITKATIKRRKRRAKFSFKAIGIASGFQCALVRRNKKHHKQPKPSFAACSSPKKYKHLKSGSYKFEVRAVSTAGADPTPAIKKFKV